MSRFKHIDTQPQFVAVCDQQGLIGRELFAIDGVKLPCNAAKGKSGTRADFIRHHKKLNRFTLRGQTKVNTQWLLFCLVHNIEKLAHNGYRTGS